MSIPGSQMDSAHSLLQSHTNILRFYKSHDQVQHCISHCIIYLDVLYVCLHCAEVLLGHLDCVNISC